MDYDNANLYAAKVKATSHTFASHLAGESASSSLLSTSTLLGSLVLSSSFTSLYIKQVAGRHISISFLLSSSCVVLSLSRCRCSLLLRPPSAPRPFMGMQLLCSHLRILKLCLTPISSSSRNMSRNHQLPAITAGCKTFTFRAKASVLSFERDRNSQ